VAEPQGDLTPDQQRDRELAAVMAGLKAMGNTGSQLPTPGSRHMDQAVGKLPGRGEWVKAAPGVAMVCATLIILTFATILAVLVVTDESTADFFRLINLFFNAFTAFGTIGLVAVALIHARRTLENRKIAEQGHSEAHDAADAAKSAASAINGGLEARMARAMAPVVKDAVDQAVSKALKEQEPRRRESEGR
jgi:succinate dehydrogenase hydrophobic anchor subunit